MNMAAQYLPIFILMLFSLLFVVLLMGAAHILGPKREYYRKQMPYECGIPPTGGVRHPFSVKFYLIALFFILFDIEIVFILPWALIFREYVGSAGDFLLIEMGLFIAVLVIGLAYIWKKGALDWDS